jgi:hypothetical protein
MPFLNTTPTTSGGGVLSNNNRVPSHWSLFAIIFWILGCYSGFNEINIVLPDCVDTFVLDILPVFFGQFEFRSEL